MWCYFENAPDFLDQPGEWCLGRTTGQVTYRPLPPVGYNGRQAAGPCVDDPNRRYEFVDAAIRPQVPDGLRVDRSGRRRARCCSSPPPAACGGFGWPEAQGGFRVFGLLIFNEVTARTPRHLGVNIELQDAVDDTNLWDWLAHSGATALREIHPARVLRRDGTDTTVWERLRTREDFQAYRRRLRQDPEQTVRWDTYRFDERLPWLGVPDDIIRKATRAGFSPVISMGYVPKLFPRPLADPEVTDRLPAESEWDWGAVASAYEYYFAMMHRFASRHGARYFMLRNEPDLGSQNLYLPQALTGEDATQERRFGMLVAQSESPGPLSGAVTNQMAILTRAARLAMDDVGAILRAHGKTDPLFLVGPGWAELWEEYWAKAWPWFDACDFHHYNRDAAVLTRRYARASHWAAKTGRKITCTEFGRIAGRLPISELLFAPEPALEVADLLMSALEMARAPDAPCELATFYHFRFPATHRNYKCLVYGDMNLLDWSGADKPLRDRGPAWYPTLAEQQIRFATPAFAAFRMLARCAPGGRTAAGHEVLAIGCGQVRGPEYRALRAQAIRTGRNLVVNLLNPSAVAARDVMVNVGPAEGNFRFCVLRETAGERRDEAVAQRPVEHGRVRLDLPPRSLTQAVFTPLALDAMDSLTLREHTATPGSLSAGLRLWQTTRLRALARVDGEDVDLSDLNVVWRSSDPQNLQVLQGGLVLRRRAPDRPAEITAETLTGVKASASCPGVSGRRQTGK
jgi:hypothetical protein